MRIARPAHLTMSADTVVRRIIILKCSADASARMCAQDAEMCLSKWDDESPFPGQNTDPDSPLPINWLESASRWVDTGRAHAFGFQVPAEW